MNEERIEWIDALKGFGIILVTFGHMNPWLPIETHIYSFHMCLFFFISGFLFKQRDSLRVFVIKKCRSILVPFVIWDLLASVIALAMGIGLKNVITQFFVINGNLCWNVPIWFLLVLFITEILYASIMKVNDSKYTIISIFICSALLWIIFGKYQLTFKLNLVPLALFFYALGNTVHRDFDKKSLPKSIVIIMTMVFGISSIIFGAIKNVRVSYVAGYFGNICFFIIASISGTMFYYLVFKNWFGNSNLLAALGRNSLIIMATHYCLFNVYDIISRKFFGVSIWQGHNTIKALVVSAVTIALIMLIVSAFKQIFRNNKKILNLAKSIGIR